MSMTVLEATVEIVKATISSNSNDYIGDEGPNQIAALTETVHTKLMELEKKNHLKLNRTRKPKTSFRL